MINLNTQQKQNLELILRDTNYKHVNADGVVMFSLNGSTVADENILQSHINNFDLLAPARNAAYQRINEQLQEYLGNLISSKYSRVEQDTFPYQRLEIEVWQKDNSALTPTIDRIALNRGVTRDEQLSKIEAKTAAFSAITDRAIGKVQGLKDTIKASEDLDFINSVNFEP